MIPHVQEFIHRFEVGEGARWLRAGVAVLATLVVAALFLLLNFQNLSDPAAMDAAQVARQIARGEGFTTRFIRPWSVRLLEQRAAEAEASGTAVDPGRLQSRHPDLAHPPLYPLVLAAGLRLLQPSFEIPEGTEFKVYEPDRVVVAINLVLLLALAGATYALAFRLFDGWVAALSTLALLGAEVPWTLAGGGGSSLLAILMVTLLAHCLVGYDHSVREEGQGMLPPLIWAMLAGVVTGLAGLTQYGLLMLAVPVLGFLFPGWGGRRWSTLAATVVALMLVVSPWLMRNHQLSGQWFGTASAALLRDSQVFPGDSLERSLTAETTTGMLNQSVRKMRGGMGRVLREELPTLGGSWVSAFFLVGLMFSFSSPTRNVLRGFAAASLLVLVPLQALLGPHAGGKSVVPGTDYLAVLGPVVLIVGTAFFVSLLDNMDWAVEGIGVMAVGAFAVVATFPLALMMLPPLRSPSAFPPYHPPLIQKIADWVGPEERLMSDMPWAVAWYADRDCLWLTQKAVEPKGREDFFAVYDFRCSVVGLYLTQLTTDQPFLSQMRGPQLARDRARARLEREGDPLSESAAILAVGWPEFVLRSVAEQWLPPGFPLRSAHVGYLLWSQLLVLDTRRWEPGSESTVAPVEPKG